MPVCSEIENFLLVCEKCCLPDGVAKQVKLCKNKGSDKWTCYGDNLSNFLLEHGGCPASGITIKALKLALIIKPNYYSEVNMPDTYKESEYKSHPIFEVYLGENKYNGNEEWFSFGLKKAQAILENIDALRKWVDRQEFPHGHKD